VSQHMRYSLYIAIALIPLMLFSCTPQPQAGNIVGGLGRQVTINATLQRTVSLASAILESYSLLAWETR